MVVALPVCICLQFQLSLSKQVLYQMVTSNYFTLSPLNCPVLSAGNKTSILFCFVFFWKYTKTKYWVQRLWYISTEWKILCVVYFFFCHFMVWISSGFSEVSWFPPRKAEVRIEGMYKLEHCSCSNSLCVSLWKRHKMAKSGTSLLRLIWIKGKCGMVLDLSVMDSVLIIKNSVM